MSEDRYRCSKCKRTHKMGSKIGLDHIQYREDEPVEIPIISADEESPDLLEGDWVKKPEEKGIGMLKIGGSTGSPPTPPNRGIPVLQKEDRTFEALSATEDSAELCKFIYWARDSCVDCQGHRCSAAADKKLAPGLVDEICRTTAHLECQYYLQALETGVPQVCPYQGPPPEEKRAACSGVWCYADDRNVRVPKSCKKFWVNCDTFARKKWAGKPFYRNLPKEPELLEEIEDREVKAEEPT